MNKNIFTKQSIISLFMALFCLPGVCFAEENEAPAPPLRFYAFNAGYKDEASQQNYDFIELEKTIEGELDLKGYELRYFNSSDKESGGIGFDDYNLTSNRLVLGYTKSPQYADAPEQYRYTFSSSGLASTGGRLQLLADGELIDEVCWGKIVCDQQFKKFTTALDTNESALLTEEQYAAYYPTIDEVALVEKELPSAPVEQTPAGTSVPAPTVEEVETLHSCAGLRFSELLSYYAKDKSEQFIELYNAGDATLALDGCWIQYKNKSYPLSGQVEPNGYTLFKDIALTKNPSSSLVLTIYDDYGIVDEMSYYHGQKAGTSNIIIDGEWLSTFQPTPGAKNVFQEFRSCPEGKVINPETGNCIKKPEAATQKECPEGYERNPETNRCRKIVAKIDANDYPVAKIEAESYDSPKIFTAVWALVALAALAVAYLIFQFRYEIAKFFRCKILRRNKRSRGRAKL